MLLNRIEFVAMNNPLRAAIQDRYEAREFKRLSLHKRFNYVLEIGCGNGTGANIIRKYFSPKSIIGLDLDEKMIAAAMRKNRYPNVHFEKGDAAHLNFKDNTFDAVFDFGVIHHVSNWEDCLCEVKRVLAPGGLFFSEEVSKETFTSFEGRLYRRLLKHPYNEMFTQNEFTDCLTRTGFKMHDIRTHYPLHLLRYFVIVASKP